jgi:predicted transcriptional regulator
MPTVESTTFVQRVVLCCLLKTNTDRMPVDAAEIRSASRKLLEAAADQSVSAVSEGDVARALNGLVDMGLIEEDRSEDRSPVGKGRPQYTLNADADTVREELQNADVGSLLN